MTNQTIREGQEERGGGDPRIGIRDDKGFVQRTINKFNANPFKSGGAQEQEDASCYEGGPEPGPSGGRKLKADRVYDRVNEKEVGRKFGNAGDSRKPSVDR